LFSWLHSILSKWFVKPSVTNIIRKALHPNLHARLAQQRNAAFAFELLVLHEPPLHLAVYEQRNLLEDVSRSLWPAKQFLAPL
jgi:hypothetical protein